jgi:hypothetical protein
MKFDVDNRVLKGVAFESVVSKLNPIHPPHPLPSKSVLILSLLLLMSMGSDDVSELRPPGDV